MENPIEAAAIQLAVNVRGSVLLSVREIYNGKDLCLLLSERNLGVVNA